MNKAAGTVFLLIFLVFSCKYDSQKIYEKGNDTNITGTINISADETVRPIIEAEQIIFEHVNPYAKLIITYKSEAEVINDFLNDSARMVIIARRLSDKEKAFFQQERRVPRGDVFGKDAIAVIVNRENPDSLMSTSLLKKLLDGTIQKWKEANPKSTLDSIELVFDNSGSSTLRELKDSFLHVTHLSPRCFALKSNIAVIEYVKNHKSAIGIIGSAWISDSDDKASMDLMNEIRVVKISGEKKDGYYAPDQSNMALNTYPFTRDLFWFHQDGKIGLGTGFASFIMGEKGQRIILKSGLLPANMPVRYLELK